MQVQAEQQRHADLFMVQERKERQKKEIMRNNEKLKKQFQQLESKKQEMIRLRQRENKEIELQKRAEQEQLAKLKKLIALDLKQQMD